METGISVGTIVFLIVSMAAIGTVWYVIYKVRHFSQKVFGTADLLKGIQDMNTYDPAKPKSVSAVTSIYLPKISRDFPDFNYDEMKRRAQKVLRSYLEAQQNRSVEYLAEGLDELKNKLGTIVENLKVQEMHVQYLEPKIHQTEICGYTKNQSRAVITFQASIQYYYTKKNANGKLVDGSYDELHQTRYNIECIHVQDRELIENAKESAVANNCPNCGAPLAASGTKLCPYCGSGIEEFNIKTWNFSDVTEIS